METKLIDSFKIDHNTLKPGLYGRAPKHGVSTFDLRMCIPNKESISPSAMHSIEHCFATYFKTISKYSEEVVSFCPGACNTMFYLELVQDFNMPVYEEIWKAINYTLSLDKVPGREKSECGNYRQHNLESAKKWLLKYRDIIDSNINGCIYAEYVAGISKRVLLFKYYLNKDYIKTLYDNKIICPDLDSIKSSFDCDYFYSLTKLKSYIIGLIYHNIYKNSVGLFDLFYVENKDYDYLQFVKYLLKDDNRIIYFDNRYLLKVNNLSLRNLIVDITNNEFMSLVKDFDCDLSFFLGILESSKISYIKYSDSYEIIFDNFKECTDFNLLLKEFKIKSVPKHGYATTFAISCIKKKDMQEFMAKKISYLDLPLSLKLLNQFK